MLDLRLALLAALAAGPAAAQTAAEESAPTPDEPRSEPLGFADVPEAELGVWASPSCDAPEVVLGRSRLGALIIQYGRPEFVFATPFQFGDGWLVSRTEDGLAYSKAEGDRLRVTNASRGRPGEGPPEDADIVELERCDGAPKSVAVEHGLGLALLEATSEWATVCGDDLENPGDGCAEAVMAFADVSGDGEVSPAEMTRFFRAALYATGAVQGEPQREEMFVANAFAMGFGPMVGWSVLQNFDYDGSGGLSLDELRTDFANVDLGALMALAEIDFFAIAREFEPMLEQLEPGMGPTPFPPTERDDGASRGNNPLLDPGNPLLRENNPLLD